MMKTNNFDAQALVQPRSREDVAAIFDEIRAELSNLHQHLDAVTLACEKDQQELLSA